MIKEIFYFLFSPLFETYYYLKADKKLKEKMEELSSQKEINNVLIDEDLVNIEDKKLLKKIYKETLARRSRIEDKSKTLNIVLTIFLTLTFGSLRYIIELLLKTRGNYFFYCFMIIYFCILIYLGISSYFSIESFSGISEVYILNYTLNNIEEILFDYKRNILLNRKQNIRKTNRISVVNVSIKVSFILMTMLIIFTIIYEIIFTQNKDVLSIIKIFKVVIY
jgi:hypothetical protein